MCVTDYLHQLPSHVFEYVFFLSCHLAIKISQGSKSFLWCLCVDSVLQTCLLLVIEIF